MAFKTVKSYNEERFGGFFRLPNDKDYADVVFLYSSDADVLVASAHYIKSADYSGYVHCPGAGCPACAKNIRVQTKLFIPLYNLTTDKIEFWDRTMRFEPQLHSDVFTNFPNPSEIVFRVTRHGAAGDVNTSYEITAIGRNTDPLGDILARNNVTFPDHYETVCKDLTASQLNAMLNAADSVSYDNMPSYQVTPRSVVPSPAPAPASAPTMEMPLSEADDFDNESIDELSDDPVSF